MKWDRRVTRLRNQRLTGDYCFKFELVHLPRRGEEFCYIGYLYGTWTNSGPLYRLYFPDINQSSKDSQSSQKPSQSNALQFLIQSGKTPSVWVAENGKVRQLTTQDSINPLLSDGIITAFDLQMPFIFWTQTAYEGSGKIHGRPAYSLLALPDNDTQYPGIQSVRVVVDRDFNALMRVDILDKNNEALRSLKVEKLKKIQDEWIIRSLDIKSSNGDRNRFQILQAAVNLSIPQEYFQSSALLNLPYTVNMDLFADIQDN
jgi:hypothetical protein